MRVADPVDDTYRRQTNEDDDEDHERGGVRAHRPLAAMPICSVLWWCRPRPGLSVERSPLAAQCRVVTPDGVVAWEHSK